MRRTRALHTAFRPALVIRKLYGSYTHLKGGYTAGSLHTAEISGPPPSLGLVIRTLAGKRHVPEFCDGRDKLIVHEFSGQVASCRVQGAGSSSNNILSRSPC